MLAANLGWKPQDLIETFVLLGYQLILWGWTETDNIIIRVNNSTQSLLELSQHHCFASLLNTLLLLKQNKSALVLSYTNYTHFLNSLFEHTFLQLQTSAKKNQRTFLWKTLLVFLNKNQARWIYNHQETHAICNLFSSLVLYL